jgi:hypothetical protein
MAASIVRALPAHLLQCQIGDPPPFLLDLFGQHGEGCLFKDGLYFSSDGFPVMVDGAWVVFRTILEPQQTTLEESRTFYRQNDLNERYGIGRPGESDAAASSFERSDDILPRELLKVLREEMKGYIQMSGYLSYGDVPDILSAGDIKRSADPIITALRQQHTSASKIRCSCLILTLESVAVKAWRNITEGHC